MLELWLDRELLVAVIDEHVELDPRRAAVVEEGVDPAVLTVPTR